MFDRFSFINPWLKVIFTLLCAALAVALVIQLWQVYMLAPWTRDGRVSVQVVRSAPDVSGPVARINVVDNQYVHRGDVLYQIDAERFSLAVAQAESELMAARATLQQKAAEAQRRRQMKNLMAVEEVQQADAALTLAQAAVQQARVTLDTARLNLQRTTQRATVDGYVTHLRLQPGDYAVAGEANVALVNAHSFWITGYFEETRLHGIHIGDRAEIRLMGYQQPLLGHVVSIGRGITDQNEQSGSLGLASVEPSFTWVRLAQRIPVHIAIDHVPPTVVLVAGMSSSIAIQTPGQPRGSLLALIQKLN